MRLVLVLYYTTGFIVDLRSTKSTLSMREDTKEYALL